MNFDAARLSYPVPYVQPDMEAVCEQIDMMVDQYEYRIVAMESLMVGLIIALTAALITFIGWLISYFIKKKETVAPALSKYLDKFQAYIDNNYKIPDDFVPPGLLDGKQMYSIDGFMKIERMSLDMQKIGNDHTLCIKQATESFSAYSVLSDDEKAGDQGRARIEGIDIALTKAETIRKESKDVVELYIAITKIEQEEWNTARDTSVANRRRMMDLLRTRIASFDKIDKTVDQFKKMQESIKAIHEDAKTNPDKYKSSDSSIKTSQDRLKKASDADKKLWGHITRINTLLDTAYSSYYKFWDSLYEKIEKYKVKS